MSMVSSSAIISWNEGKRILGELNDPKEQFCISYENECPGKERKSLPLARHFHVLLLCETIHQHVLWVCPCRWAKMVQLQFWWFLKKIFFFMFLLELKDVMRLCGLRTFYHRWAYFFSKVLIISLRLIFLILKTNKAFHPAAAKWSIKAIKRLYSSAWWKLSIKWSAA